MYERMQFADYIVGYALQANTDCLQKLAVAEEAAASAAATGATSAPIIPPAAPSEELSADIASAGIASGCGFGAGPATSAVATGRPAPTNPAGAAACG